MGASTTLRSPRALADAGLVSPDRLPELERVAARYAVSITPTIAELIDPADPADPIARQFVPTEVELQAAPGEDADPIGDAAHSPVPGVVHRYPDRVLLKPTHACAVYCRFCFRREVVGPGGAGSLSAAELDAALAYIAATSSIWEVIVTGGDPLVLTPRRLRSITERLSRIEHVKIVRFHTRVPVVAPEMVTAELVTAMKGSGKTTYVALHANHARELTDEACAACARIVDAGVPMLGQTVLLRGVNDDPQVLMDLLRRMVEARVKPYYLHHADLALGTAHLRTRIEDGRALMAKLRGDVSGLCQPTLMLDIPGGHGKAPIGPDHLQRDKDGGLRVLDPWGAAHAYCDPAS